MGDISRRRVVATAAGAAAAATTVVAAGCSSDGSAGSGRTDGSSSDRRTGKQPDGRHRVRLIGDGSTSDTGPQPHQPAVDKLKPGEEPPQFVVFSWDGAGVARTNYFERFRNLADAHGAKMTFFLSGIYMLPERKKLLYRPPLWPAGASAIGYLTDEHIHATIKEVTAAWSAGHEIGTHFNGHFCGPTGVKRWTPAMWDSEIAQAKKFVKTWKTNTGFTDLPAFPFDYEKELMGGRTPCLEGRDGLLPTAAKLGWRYDASSPGGLQMWPGKKLGLWDFPLQSIPFPGHSFQVLSMDYNLMANQSAGNPKGNPAMRATWKKEAHASYVAGFERALTTNRAPFFIGNHFEDWNGGIYMDAVEEAFLSIVGTPGVRLVTFKQLVHWLDAQDPAVLAKLGKLTPGQKPPGGWASYLA
ncbi:hypothetical protein BIV57_07160 [Mangrovactinospora gilvigrisea]|uniref:Lipoprotein n=1 Tax=Mangrovactinospora gilvigrisea TaxID=1428644 RepID=A0A1J7BHH9_9ACTN|nr:hypothetical protein [Mangrovactinospora gilvigrisea]OIV38151.1 hypothetical protein BIV57_07160 [Mangrovactinospora gilvigrisea]